MLVSRNVFHVVLTLQSIVFIHFFWLVRSLVDRGSVYRMRSFSPLASRLKRNHDIVFYRQATDKSNSPLTLAHLKGFCILGRVVRKTVTAYYKDYKLTKVLISYFLYKNIFTAYVLCGLRFFKFKSKQYKQITPPQSYKNQIKIYAYIMMG